MAHPIYLLAVAAERGGARLPGPEGAARQPDGQLEGVWGQVWRAGRPQGQVGGRVGAPREGGKTRFAERSRRKILTWTEMARRRDCKI